MRVVSQSSEAAVVELTREEVELIAAVMSNVQTGPNQIEDEDWEAHIGLSREVEDRIVDSLGLLVQNFTKR